VVEVLFGFSFFVTEKKVGFAVQRKKVRYRAGENKRYREGNHEWTRMNTNRNGPKCAGDTEREGFRYLDLYGALSEAAGRRANAGWRMQNAE
jgi:hypothetical protein